MTQFAITYDNALILINKEHNEIQLERKLEGMPKLWDAYQTTLSDLRKRIAGRLAFLPGLRDQSVNRLVAKPDLEPSNTLRVGPRTVAIDSVVVWSCIPGLL